MLLRFWIHFTRVNPPAQIGNFIYIFTNWIVGPLSKVIPGVNKQKWASLLCSILAAAIATCIKSQLITPFFMYKFVLILAFLTFFNWVVYGIMGLLILEVVFSWVNPQAPLAPLIRALNGPILRPIRSIIPPISGIDLSILIAFVVLNIVSRYVPELLLGLI
jgi:YggT family protein